MMCTRFTLSLRNSEDLLHERGIDITHETVCFWWNRFGWMFAALIRKRRIESGNHSNWTWHLDEVCLHAYRSVAEARASLARFLTFCNTKRPRSSLDQKTADQACANALQPIPVTA